MIIWSNRWPSFTMEEVLSPDQLSLYETKGVFSYSFRALDKLQELRDFVRVPLFINHGGKRLRGARSTDEVYRVNVGTRGFTRGWEYSFHLWCAFDISTETPTQEATYALYKKVLEFGKFMGVGLYTNFVHIDDRDTLDGLLVTWDNRPSPI